MVGPNQNVNGLCGRTMLHSGMVCRPDLALARINPYAKFEVSMTIHYEDMKGDINVENGVVWGS